MGQIWNADFTKTVPEGAAGNQAQKGIFFDDDKGITQRLTEAEGHEIGYNPESVERNPIGQEAPSTEIRSYNLTIDKDIIVKKGAPNYEFFAQFMRLRPTGDNAKMRIYLVDFRIEEVGANHNKYYAETIQKVISRYGYTPEFLGLEKQVGAVVSSLQISPQLNEKSRKIDTARKTSFKDDNKKYLNSLYNFDILSNILKTGQSQTVENKELGNIYIDKGLNGKKGYGLLHIIEDRTQEGRNDEETSAIIHLVTQAAKEGKITREIPFRDNPKHKGRVELEKNGIIAILSRQRYKGDDEKWILTGFDNKNKKEEATGAIQTVIAQYGRSLEFSGFRNQVGAVVSSLQISHQQNEKSREIETARKAGYVQGVCECVAIIVDNHTLGKKLLTEMKVTKDMAKKFANPETFKTLEQGIFAPKDKQKQEQTNSIKR